MSGMSTLLVNLPDDMIMEILLRLPVKSLLCFKCVCKSWRLIISDSQFVKSHFDLAARPTHRFLLNFSVNSKIYSLDTDVPLNSNSGKVVLKIPSPSSPFHCVDVVGSCRGFLLLTSPILMPEFNDFIIWNPSTGQQKLLRKVWKDPCLYGIGYDSSTDDYLVVCLTLPCAPRKGWFQCFSSRTNSWSCSEEGTVPYMIEGKESRHGWFLNGALHWLVNSYDHRPVIIALDVTKRRLYEIPLPRVGSDFRLYHFTVMEGCLCLYFPCLRNNAQLWTMKEYKVRSSWTRSFIVSANCSPFFPICFTRDGGIFGYDTCQTLMRLNNKGELLERRPHELCKHRIIYLHDYYMYRESLLSLPKNFEKLTKLR